MKKFLILSVISILILNIFFVSAIDKVVYPLYSSVCCELGSSFRPSTDAQTTISQKEVSYICKINSECRLRNPVVNCPGKSISNLWLGYTAIWQIKTPGGYYKGQTKADGTQIGDNSAGLVGIPFTEGQSVSYSGSCANNAKWVWRISTNFISMFFEGAQAPTSSSLIIEEKVGILWRNPALEGHYSIDGTQYCQFNEKVREYAENLPKNDLLGKNSSETAQPGSSTPPQQTTKELLDETRYFLDECRLGVDKYIELPFQYNVNPKGKYNNKDVICSQSKGIVEIVPSTTEGESTYYVLGSRLKSTGFCCNDLDCKTYGNNYNCEQNTYECKEIPGYCNNDLDCQPSAGEKFDSNCYRKIDKFYKWSSSCINNRCSPFPAQETQVKCCPSYCSLTNQICDINKGCYTPETPLPDCPSGFCCDGTTNRAQSCLEGLNCCYETGKTVGICKEECVVKPECTKNEDCESNQECENNKCINVKEKIIECKWYKDPYTKEKGDCGFLGWRNINDSCKPISGCKNSTWVYVVAILIIIIILVLVYRIYSSTKRKIISVITK